MQFLGGMSAQSEGKALNSSDDPERKIHGVEKEDPLVLRKTEVHGEFNECMHGNDDKADEQQPNATKKHQKGEQFYDQSGCINEHAQPGMLGAEFVERPSPTEILIL